MTGIGMKCDGQMLTTKTPMTVSDTAAIFEWANGVRDAVTLTNYSIIDIAVIHDNFIYRRNERVVYPMVIWVNHLSLP